MLLPNVGFCFLSGLGRVSSHLISTTLKSTQQRTNLFMNNITPNVTRYFNSFCSGHGHVTGLFSKATMFTPVHLQSFLRRTHVTGRALCELKSYFRSPNFIKVSPHIHGCRLVGCRFVSASANRQTPYQKRNRSSAIYITAIGIFMIGGAYAGVPLYRIFCQATGIGGQPTLGHDIDKVETMSKVSERIIKVKFNADVASSMRWNFKPQQTEVTLSPGETALAFYTATNPTDKPIIGISTYNVVPYEAGLYFNKIQCFCFEEQRLNPHEQVDMPVFFFIDPDFVDDPKLEHVDTIHLSYTFFEAKEGLQLPLPGYMSLPQTS